MDRTPLTGTPSQIAAIAFSSPGAPSTMRKAGRCRPRSTRSSRTARQVSVLSPPMFLSASNTFWPSSRTPMTTSNDIEGPCGRAGPTPRCRPGSAARSAPRRAGRRSRPPVGLHLPPHPAHRVLANRTAEQRRERSADPARLPPQRRYRRTLAKYISMRRCLHYQTALADSSAA
jgi:hypothetical protein